jgi:hypothetical protein
VIGSDVGVGNGVGVTVITDTVAVGNRVGDGLGLPVFPMQPKTCTLSMSNDKIPNILILFFMRIPLKPSSNHKTI